MKTKTMLGCLIYFACLSRATSQNVSTNLNAVPLGVGVNNVGIGSLVLLSLTSGDDNTGIGNNALRNNQSGNFNTAAGGNALFNNATGNNNTVLGFGADVSTGGLNNATAIGSNAVVTTNNAIQLGDAGVTQVFSGVGTNATFISGGLQITGGAPGIGKVLTSDASGVATWQTPASGGGAWSLFGNSGTVDGVNFIGTTTNVPFTIRVNNQKAGRIDHLVQNVFFGYRAGNVSGVTTWGNVGIGHESMLNNSMGYANVGVGYETLKSNTFGEVNSAVGFRALLANTVGYNNSAFGADAMLANTTGNYNTAIGWNSLTANSSGYNNTAVGIQALVMNTTGNDNTSIGRNALWHNTTGTHNTGIGMYTDVSAGNLYNATAVGMFAIVNSSNKVVIGNTAASIVIGGYATAGWSNLSDGRFKENIKEEVPGLDFIVKLRPVSYTINTKKLDEHLMQNMPDSIKQLRMQKPDEYAKASDLVSIGFIAQEVEKTVNELGVHFDGVNTPKNNTDNYSIGYAKFVVPLVKAVQEQQLMIAEQKQENQKLQAQMEELKALVSSFAGHSSSQNKNAKNNNIAVELSDKNVVVLNQNVPNPFAESTVISYNIPTEFTKAQILFSTNEGKVIRVVNITEKGEGNLSVFANDLTNGLYSYTLVVDGKTIDTKKMIKE